MTPSFLTVLLLFRHQFETTDSELSKRGLNKSLAAAEALVQSFKAFQEDCLSILGEIDVTEDSYELEDELRSDLKESEADQDDEASAEVDEMEMADEEDGSGLNEGVHDMDSGEEMQEASGQQDH